MPDIKIGVVIADLDEYKPFAESVKRFAPRKYAFYNNDALSFDYDGYEIICLFSGVGKVNAAAAAMHLVDIGCSYILNFGLSGGISGVKRSEVNIPDKFLEHDFDLTLIGYKPCEKPWQKYVYSSDGFLKNAVLGVFGDLSGGTAVCGDRFICRKEDRDFLKDTFDATTCDLETGAIASVCDFASVPFLSIRRVSDDAGDDALSSYRNMNINEGTALADIFIMALGGICNALKEKNNA